MAIWVTLRRTADEVGSATYEFGFGGQAPHGLIRVDKKTGATERLQGVPSAASRRAEWLLARCVEEGEYPDALEWQS